MSQLIEGVDNEITIAFFMFSGAAAIALPWYFLRPRENAPTTTLNQRWMTRSTSENNGNSSSTTPLRNNEQVLPVERVENCENRTVNTDVTDDSSRNEFIHNSPRHTAAGGSMTIKIKLHENNREVVVPTAMTLGALKRYCFQSDLDHGQNVRLIYNGRILQGDGCSLGYLGLSDGCVVHAQISEHQTVNSEPHQQDQLEIGFLFVPSIAVILILGWVAVLVYDEIFSALSIALLSLLSGLFLLLACFS